MVNRSIFISGIGTDVGKTIVSAILAEAWHADYFKPIQAGNPESGDAVTVKNLISNQQSIIHPSAYTFTHAASPHQAAALENKIIDLNNITLPSTNNPLIIEGAGGLMVPLNEKYLVIDLIKKLNIPVLLVSKNYLGAINHTLLTIEVLKNHSIPMMGIVYNGGDRNENMTFIARYTNIATIGFIPELEVINKEVVLREAAKFASINPFR